MSTNVNQFGRKTSGFFLNREFNVGGQRALVPPTGKSNNQFPEIEVFSGRP